MTARNRSILTYLLRLLFTAALLALVFHLADVRRLSAMLGSVHWEYLGALPVLVVVLFWLQAAKSRYILAQQGCDVSTGRLFCLSAIISLYNMILPGILGTGIKWYLLKKDTGKGAQAFSAMAYNQVSIMLVMTGFGLAALMLNNPLVVLSGDTQAAQLLSLGSGLLLVAIVAASVLLLNRRTGGWFVEVCIRILRPLPARFRTRIEALLRQVATFHNAGYRFHLTMLVLTIVVNLSGAVAVYFVAARATNVAVSIGVLVWIAGVLYVLGRMPVSIANLGIREVTLVAFLPIYGVDQSAALLMSLAVFLATVIRAFIGAFCQIFWTARAKQAQGAA